MPRSQVMGNKRARWQNGYAADCKSVDLGSTPGRASINFSVYKTEQEFGEFSFFDKKQAVLIPTICIIKIKEFARVVESVDTRDLKSLAE